MLLKLKCRSIIRQVLIITLSLLFIAPSESWAKEKEPEFNYNIESAGNGAQGTALVKITVITKDKKVSDAELARCAVHGLLFRGVPGQRPLAGSALVESQNAPFFKDFFSTGGAYKNYVQVLGLSRDIVKSGKEYHVTTTVTVNKDQLRRDLETAGVIKSLDHPF